MIFWVFSALVWGKARFLRWDCLGVRLAAPFGKAPDGIGHGGKNQKNP
jgi:hypothetical protein